jgi:hypothetical protein
MESGLGDAVAWPGAGQRTQQRWLEATITGHDVDPAKARRIVPENGAALQQPWGRARHRIGTAPKCVSAGQSRTCHATVARAQTRSSFRGRQQTFFAFRTDKVILQYCPVVWNARVFLLTQNSACAGNPKTPPTSTAPPPHNTDSRSDSRAAPSVGRSGTW